MKKALSILLCIVMVLSMVSMTAMAAGEDVVLTVTADKQDANRGDTVNFTVTLAPISKGTASFSFNLDIPEGLTYVPNSAHFSDTAKTEMKASDTDHWTDAELLVSIYGLGDGYTATTDTVLITFACTVDSTAKGAKSVGLKTVEFFDANDAAMTAVATPVSVTALKGSDYTPASIDMTYDTLAITDKTAKSVAPTGITGKDTEGDDLPQSDLAKITYAFKGTAPAGLSIDAKTGVVTVSDAAKVVAGTVTVTATLGTTNVTKDVDITVTKAESTVTSVSVTGPSAALIKADGDKPYTFTATILDQYGAEMTSKTVAWSTTPETLPEGLTFADGVLTVASTTPAASKGNVKITATVEGQSGDFTTNVTDIEFPGLADVVKVAEKATYGDEWTKIVTIPANFAGKAGDDTVNGTLTLKYEGEAVPAASAEGADKGPAFQVIFNATGFENVVAFEGNAPVIAKKDVTVTADNVRVDLKKELPTEWTCTIEGLLEGDELTGTATFVINGGEAVDTSVKGEYTIAVSGLTDESGNYNVTFVDGTLTVKKKNTTPPAYGTGTNPDGTEKDPDDHPTTDTSVFDDVKEGDWFYDAVNYVAENKLMTGTADKIFEPNTNTSRAMIATILWRQSGSPEPVARIADFPDVDADAWYIKAVRWCAEKEIVTGYENGNFGPNDLITREQMAAMFYRYAGSPEVDAAMGMAGFTDVDAISEWAATAMRWAVQNGILNGKDGGMLDPQGLATRAETAAVLQRYLSKK